MTPADLEFVAELVRRHAGVVIRADKAFFIETRLGPVARREKVPGVPALLVTAEAEFVAADLARRGGFDGFWSKPLDVAATLRSLERWLG